MAYTTTGRQVYCLSGLFLHGADPGKSPARFFPGFDSFWRDPASDSQHRCITDITGDKPLSINDSLHLVC